VPLEGRVVNRRNRALARAELSVSSVQFPARNRPGYRYLVTGNARRNLDSALVGQK
jgi:hypothetical protein